MHTAFLERVLGERATGGATPAARPAVVSGVQPGTLLYGTALAAALIWMIYQPMAGIPQTEVGAIRHVPLAIAILAMSVDWICDPASRVRFVLGVRAHWSFAVLAIWIAIGALVTRFQQEINATFLTQALCCLGFFIAYQFAPKLIATRPASTVLKILPLIGVSACLLAAVAFFMRRPILHEAAYLFIPWLGYLILRRGGLHVFVAGFAFIWLLLIGPLSLKNTAAILAALTIFGVYMGTHSRRYGLGPTFSFVRTWGLGAVGLGLMAAVWLLAPRPEGFSSGNAEFRMWIYGLRWEQFVASPIIGEAWMGPPYVRFTLFALSSNAPMLNAVTHNDHLDLLVHGGLIGACLMLLFYVTVFRNVARFLNATTLDDRQFGYILTLTVSVVGGLIAMCFNPVLGNSTNGFMFWSFVGLLAGSTHFFLHSPRGDGSAPTPFSPRGESPPADSVPIANLGARPNLTW